MSGIDTGGLHAQLGLGPAAEGALCAQALGMMITLTGAGIAVLMPVASGVVRWWLAGRGPLPAPRYRSRWVLPPTAFGLWFLTGSTASWATRFGGGCGGRAGWALLGGLIAAVVLAGFLRVLQYDPPTAPPVRKENAKFL